MSQLAFHQATIAQARRVIHEGREHLVAPVVAVRAGVLNGMLCPVEEIGRYPDAWNGIPVPVNHPMDRGMPISANQPDLVDRVVIGRFYGAHMDGDALHGDLYIDIAKAQELGGEAIEVVRRLEAGQPLEVSTAYFHDTEAVSGQADGVQYDGVQRNLRPDHLAVLPRQIGACSWQDGCGAPRLNQRGGMAGVRGQVKQFLAGLGRAFGLNVAANEMSHEEIKDALHGALKEKLSSPDSFTRERWPWLRATFDDRVIYEVEGPGASTGELYQRTYTVDQETQEVTLSEAVKVVQKIAFEVSEDKPAGNTSAAIPSASPSPTGNPPDKSTANGQPAAGNTAPSGAKGENQLKKALIDGLIVNQATSLEESDRPWLDGLTEEQLKRLEPVAKDPAANTGGCGAKPAAELKPPAVNQTQKPVTADEYIDQAPAEIRELLANGLKAERERREGLLSTLKANQRCAFAEDELKGMSTEQLDKLSRSLSPEDYSGRGGPRANVDDDEIPAPPPVVMAPVEKGGK